MDGDFRTYTYDAFGSRAVQQTDDGTTTYVGKLYEQRESISAGDSHVFLVHGEPGVVAQVSYESTGKKRRFITSDNLSTATVVMLESTTVERAFFDPFGARIQADGAPTADADPNTTLGFTGHEEDDESLVNMGGRIYDRAQYRFLSPDPIISRPLFGQSYNPYSYVLNNPLRYNDPTGFQQADQNGQYIPHDWVSSTVTHQDGRTETIWYDPRVCPGGCSMEHLPSPATATDGDAGRTEVTVTARPPQSNAPQSDEGKTRSSHGTLYTDPSLALPEDMWDGGILRVDPAGRHVPRGMTTAWSLDPSATSVVPQGAAGTEVIFWHPSGSGASSFGHVSLNIGDMSFSYSSDNKSDAVDRDSYMTRASVNGATGLELGLTGEQEALLVESYRSFDRTQYNALQHNCADPIEIGLRDTLGLPGGTSTPEGLFRQILPHATRRNEYGRPAESYLTHPWGEPRVQNFIDHPVQEVFLFLL